MGAKDAAYVAIPLLLGLIISGCLTPANGSDENDAETTSNEDLMVSFSFSLSDCTDALVLGTIATTEAQRLLPPGFSAADGTALLLGSDSPLPVPTGQTIGYFDAIHCEGSSLGGPIGVSHNGIQIRPPDLGSEHPLPPAANDFFIPMQHYTHQSLVYALVDRGVATVANATIESMFMPMAPTGGTGIGSVTDDTGLAYDFGYRPSGPFELDGLIRLWYWSPEGVGFYGAFFDQDQGALGPLESCTARPGTWAHTLGGGNDCSSGGVAGIFTGMGYNLELTWYSGVQPSATKSLSQSTASKPSWHPGPADRPSRGG